jgi:polyisoprenoid-binding protein YceI
MASWRLGSFTTALFLCVVLCGCRGRDAATTSTSDAPRIETSPVDQSTRTVAGVRAFVIVPAESKASYRANEEFFPAALSRLGIKAGRIQAVGSTRQIEGRFEFDPERPTAPPGENMFTVRLNTLTSDQQKRDEYLREVRDDGPSFDAYPLATFKGTSIDGDSTANAGRFELNLKLTGDLTVREITKREVFDVKAQLTGDTLAGVATTRFLLTDFGIGPIDFPPLLAVANPIEIEVQFTARAQQK